MRNCTVRLSQRLAVQPVASTPQGGDGTLWAVNAVGSADDVGRFVRLAGEGEERAWAELVDRFSPMLWAIARGYRLSREDTADAIQTAWLRLLQHIGELREPHLVGGWLATTVRRQCLGIRGSPDRSRVRGLPDAFLDEQTDLAADAPGVDDGLLRAERQEVLYEALMRLPARQRLLLRLLAASPPPSYRDISAATGIPVGSIGPTRARALQRLRDMLVEQDLLAS
jgi:RNA polymerase sigma factor (sigma-70 family)